MLLLFTPIADDTVLCRHAYVSAAVTQLMLMLLPLPYDYAVFRAKAAMPALADTMPPLDTFIMLMLPPPLLLLCRAAIVAG